MGLDKSVNVVYNTSMLNEKKLTRRNEMIEKLEIALIIGSGILAVAMCAIGCSWVLLNTL